MGQSYSPETGQRGITVLFSSPLALGQDFNRLLVLRDSQGNELKRDWLPSRNPRSIYMPNLTVGTYSLSIEPVIQDVQGNMLRMLLTGPVHIR